MTVKRFPDLGVEVANGQVRAGVLRTRVLGPLVGAHAEVSGAVFQPVAFVILKDGTTHKHKVGAFGGRARSQALEFNILAGQA